MTTSIKYPVIPAAAFIWVGFVGAISFMEAWLKFQVPGVTLSLGLGIGRLVFSALNKVEWVLALVILVQIYRGHHGVFVWKNLFFLIPLTILILQTSVLLPILDLRAMALMAGQGVPGSHVHIYYVGAEMVKVFSLVTFGFNFNKT